MKRFIFTCLFVVAVMNARNQVTRKIADKKLEMAVGTFSTLNEAGAIAIHPVIQGNWNDYYFDNRYGYEAAGSTSFNVGKRILKKVKHTEIMPMAGFVFGSLKGLTAALQTSLDYDKWYISTDNQYSYDYAAGNRSLYFNWTIAGYKLTKYLRVGLTSFFDKRIGKCGVFDKGATLAIVIGNWTLRLYAFNYNMDRRYYSAGLRYTFNIII